MKQAFFFLCSISIVVACNKKDGSAASNDSTTHRTDTLIIRKSEDAKVEAQGKKFDTSFLQGTWWLNKNDVSALFKIEGDHLYYTEELNSPYLIKVKADTLWMIRDKHETAFKLRTLTKDSLIFYDENIGENVSLVRKKIN